MIGYDTEIGRYEVVRLDGRYYITTEDGYTVPAVAGGDFGISALLIIGIIGIVVAVAAAGASAYMMYQQGQAQKKAAKFNAELAMRQADQQKKLGQARAEDIRERNRRMIATMEAGYGAAGVEAGPGTSPLAALAYNAREGELDALRAEWTGNVNAEAKTADAAMMRWQGRNAAWAANWGAGTTLLGGLGGAASSGYRVYAGAGGAA